MEPETELQLQVDVGENVRTIRAEGELSITTAGALKTALVEGLRTEARTVLDASSITSVDLAGLQLVCSAHRTYRARDAALEFSTVSEVVRKTAVAAGFEVTHSSCPYRQAGECLWRFECPKSS